MKAFELWWWTDWFLEDVFLLFSKYSLNFQNLNVNRLALNRRILFILIYYSIIAKVWLLKKLYKCLGNIDMFCVWCMVCWFYESSKPQKLETRFINLINTTRWTLPNIANHQVPILDPANVCCCFAILYILCCECDISF